MNGGHGMTLWSEPVGADAPDVRAMLLEVAQQLAETLGRTPTPTEANAAMDGFCAGYTAAIAHAERMLAPMRDAQQAAQTSRQFIARQLGKERGAAQHRCPICGRGE